MYKPIDRKCPLCQSANAKQVTMISHDVCGIGRLSFGISCCFECGMVYQAPLTNPEAIEAQYKAFSNYTFTPPGVPPLPAPGQRLIDAVEAAKIAPGRVYDVGTATGDYLYHFRERGWQVGGCDPSPRAAELGFKHYGLTIAVGGEEECLPRENGLDLVMFSHVLEHLPDPVATLKRANRALGDGKYVAFEFPCLVDPQDMPPGYFMMEHFNYSSEQTTRRMIASAGFSPVSIKISLWEGRHYPVITVLAQKVDHADLDSSNDFERAIGVCDEYLAREQALWDGVSSRIADAFPTKSPAYAWGAGLHTSTLLERSNLLDRADVRKLFDRDAQKTGYSMRGVEISAGPDVALPDSGKIVISSYVAEAEIAAMLAARGVSPDRIVRLYT